MATRVGGETEVGQDEPGSRHSDNRDEGTSEDFGVTFAEAGKEEDPEG